MNPAQKLLQWLFSLLGAASCWWMAFSLYQNWHLRLTPATGGWLPDPAGIFVLEFILVHSGAMLPMLAASKNLKPPGGAPILFVSLLYVLFIVTVSAAFKSWQLVLTFSGIMIPRWIGLAGDSATARQRQINRSLESFFVFFLSTVVCLFWLQIPPDATLALYFAAIGLLEITSPLRTKSLLQSKVAGCIVILLVFGAFPFMALLRLFKALFHK